MFEVELEVLLGGVLLEEAYRLEYMGSQALRRGCHGSRLNTVKRTRRKGGIWASNHLEEGVWTSSM